jgi:hypothetical protein
MMQFAPVANLPMYDRMQEMGILGDYHLLIASEVVKDIEAWSNFWVEEADQFIIMDNGLIELGYPCDPETLKQAAEAVHADCIVLPDVLGDFEKTLKAVKSSYHELSTLGYPMLGVVQGRTFDQVEALMEFYEHIGVSYVSIPRVMVSIFGSRIPLVKRVQSYGLPIHLLGFSDNLYDDMLAASLPGVMGIDSAVPLWYLGTLPTDPPVDADFGRRPVDYWTMDADQPNYSNVERIRTWLKGAKAVPMQPSQLLAPEETSTHL